jgi:L-arabinose isomerase
MSATELRVGLCGVGLDAYWPQFAGLRERLDAYLAHVAGLVAQTGAVVEILGLVDTPEKGREAGHACRRADIDLLIIHVTTYALSSTVLPIVQRAQVSVLVLSLQPEAAIDYEAFNQLPDRTAMTGEWLAFCSACSVPEIANVLRRAQIPFHQVTGVIGDKETCNEISEWVHAARVRKALQINRLGLMGHYYGGMLDIATDLTQVSITFGCHVEHIEVDELSALRTTVNSSEIADRIADFKDQLDIQPDCTEEELARAARTSVALDRLAELHDLHSLAYEVKNVLAMKILDELGAGGSFTEYYALDLNLDHVLMGHDGPGHIAIAESKTRVRPLTVYHGKVGKGLSVEMTVKHGPVTLLSVVDDAESGFKLLVAEGECVPGPVLRIGNTNSHYRFALGAKAFVEAWNVEGPAHHCAVGIGQQASKLKKLGALLQIPVVQVC